MPSLFSVVLSAFCCLSESINGVIPPQLCVIKAIKAFGSVSVTIGLMSSCSSWEKLNAEMLIGKTTAVDHTRAVVIIYSRLRTDASPEADPYCSELQQTTWEEFSAHVCQEDMGFYENSHCWVLRELMQNYLFSAFSWSSMSLKLTPLSNRLTCCVTHLSPQAVFKDNHLDRKATRRHCYPLCPLPVRAAELLRLLLSVELFCLSSLCHCTNTPSYIQSCLLGKGWGGGVQDSSTPK